MKKRILSLMLTLCMILVMLPVTVFAAGNIAEVTAKEGVDCCACRLASIKEIHIYRGYDVTVSFNANKLIEVEPGNVWTIGESDKQCPAIALIIQSISNQQKSMYLEARQAETAQALWLRIRSGANIRPM